ncbi:MAG: DUF1844 domain-containing protein [Desulfobulbaceae bacterium]|nr:DUF1844 domain-containing protein [Desulfobulbaceae bacterium]HIJ78829.1 DUF1844 domain-containing protein [Deltaproteobacteria bacterium]
MNEDKKCGKPCPEGQIRKGGKCVMPEVTFTTLIMSLNTSALFHLGELEDPITGQNGKDLVLAGHTIDTLQLLRDKTKGNLTEKEQQLLDNILADLKIRYANKDS